MRILVALTYYRPHISGLTLYAERLASALVRRGHQVTVLTSRYERRLPAEETHGGVTVRRVSVIARIGKGVVMPTIGWRATREILRHDAVVLHLPQLDAAGIALRSRLLKRPTVLIYHCDLKLPPGAINRLAERVVDVANAAAIRLAHHVVAYTEDFASSSPLLQRCGKNLAIVLPPVPPPADLQAQRSAGRQRPIIGMATRFAAEKGVDVLLDALPAVFARHPTAEVWFAGQVEDVWGEADLRARLLPKIATLESAGRWRFLGVLPPEAMGEFYRQVSVLVVPSLNSTETFGLVQIEAMMLGVPVVASDLPGVRQPVTMTGMGRVVAVGDAAALAGAIVDLLDRPVTASMAADEIVRRFSPDTNAAAIERLLGEL